MKRFSNYLTPVITIITVSENDIVCASTQIDVFAVDRYKDAWSDASWRAD